MVGERCQSIQEEELLEFVNFTKCRICTKYESTVVVSLAARPCCVYRDINTRWGALTPPPPEVLVSSWCGLMKPFIQHPASPVFLRPLVIDALLEKINCCVVNGLEKISGVKQGVAAELSVKTGPQVKTA